MASEMGNPLMILNEKPRMKMFLYYLDGKKHNSESIIHLHHHPYCCLLILHKPHVLMCIITLNCQNPFSPTILSFFYQYQQKLHLLILNSVKKLHE
ncbi:hypothetical protein L2E82_31708 [Cichorium intybus]|uniref:Uncharacterized protein n=1 Tax=Cichorium intybus TaxID=13427 RepID=A0ACB9BIQ7_CICIN|nr:hypothetical protein L2E82_31708 [Cichorium intybus]